MKYLFLLIIFVSSNCFSYSYLEYYNVKKDGFWEFSSDAGGYRSSIWHISFFDSSKCTNSNNIACYSSPPSSKDGYDDISWSKGYLRSSSSGKTVLFMGCPSDYDAYVNGKKVSDISLYDFDIACVTKPYCPDLAPIMLGDYCVRQVFCNEGIYNYNCPPQDQFRCFSDQDALPDIHGGLYCAIRCSDGFTRESDYPYQCIKDVEEPDPEPEPDECQTTLSAIDCFKIDILNAINNLSISFDNFFSNLFNILKKIFEESTDEYDQIIETNLPIKNIEPNFIDSLFPTNAKCPSDSSLNIMGNEYTFSYLRLCNALSLLSNIVMILALYISYRIVRSS